ncbi:MAG: PKD domain-containing protein [Bacteroidetes bacterium]|nr:PKD domain-containing protein [Bacteroidota bacterium]
MKRLLTLLSLSLCTLLSHAQITFTSTDIASAGWVNVMQKDTQTGTVNFGNRGANQVYDFHTLQNNVPDTLFYENPTNAQTSAIPGATLALTGDHNTYIFAKNQSTLFSYVGGQAVYNGATLLTPFSPIDTGYKFTTAYGQNFRGTYGFTTSQPGSTFGQPSIYMVRITNTTTYTDTIDGWGKVITPLGTYDCLRQHRVEHSSTLLEYSLCSVCGYSNVPTSSTLPANPIVSNTNTYYYITKEAHGSVISFTTDANGNPKTASWSKTPPTPVANFGYTLGASGSVAFHDSTTGTPVTYSWNYGDNTTTGTTASPTHSYAANGTYYVCLTVTNVSGTSTHCDSVHITNIVAATTPPTAGNDTASLVQPGTVTIHALANDVNHNAGDTLCINSLIGATTGWATISGCNNIVYHPLDSNYAGLDTFYYKVCDIHVPTLCDTAMVVVNVTVPVVIVPPVIHYTLTPGNCSFTLTDNSTNIDSIHYHLVVTGPLNSLDVTVTNPSNYHSSAGALGGTLSICITAYGQDSIVSRCDTTAVVCVGINEIPTSQFAIYPNPASDRILLDLSHVDQNTMSEIAGIEVYSILGERLRSMAAKASNEISVADLSTGIYLIGLRDTRGNKRVLGKFEVMH